MSGLIVKSREPGSDGCVLEVTPESAGWQYVGFSVHQLLAGQVISRDPSTREACIVVLSGKVTVATGEHRFESIGERESVFDRVAPHAVYTPGDLRTEIEAVTAAEVAICTAPSGAARESYHVRPGQLPAEERGDGSNKRYVQDILPESLPASHLLVVEVITPPGNWSSYPPHKHDRDQPPVETALEETYFHKLNPRQGFAIQRVYTDDRSLDETMTVEDGDCVLVPRGYHPVGAPHGYELYYLNVMAGPTRHWVFKNDPQHEWIVTGSQAQAAPL